MGLFNFKSNEKEFNATKKVGTYFYVDDNNKQWVIPDCQITGKIKKAIIHNYNEIINYELLEDGNSLYKGGLGSAIVGGALFGGVGAIVGSTIGAKKAYCSKLQIKITLNNINNPVEYVNLIESNTKKDNFIYKTCYNSAQEIISILQIICNSNNK